MRRLALYIAVIVWFLVSCEKDENKVKVPTSEIPVIEGFYRTNIQGDVTDIIGVPNSTNESDDIWMSHPYPNPALKISNVYVSINREFKHASLWLTPALLAGQELNPGTSNNGVYFIAGGFIVYSTDITESGRTYTFSLPPGAYRIYLLCDNTLLYDNLIMIE